MKRISANTLMELFSLIGKTVGCYSVGAIEKTDTGFSTTVWINS